MSWNRQDFERFDTSTKLVLRAARKISEKNNFPSGYFPIETLIGVMIDMDHEVNWASKLVGLSSRFFHEGVPSPSILMNPLDHPALLLPRVVSTQSNDSNERLRPIHIMNYVLRSNHPGINGILGLRIYRQGQLQHQTLIDAFTPTNPLRLKVAA